MKIATFVYQKVLRSRGIKNKFWNFARRLIVKIAHDPICSLTIHERQLELPLSHALPTYLQAHKHYDRLPIRISKYLHQTQGNLRCIDVGANIGDSVAAFYKNKMDSFLAIEPNPSFHKHLVANWSWNKNVKIINTICSSECAVETFTIQEKHGTASIINAKNGVTMNRQSLDSILNDFPEFKDANILKIDTDGHDFEVIAGAKNLISSGQPVILFECDAFGNENYVEDCLKVLKFFLSSGYNYFLLYDNFGNLIGKYPLVNLSSIQSLLFYQLTSPFYYFDILLMKDADISNFFKKEVDYFVGEMPNKTLQRTANAAAEL